MVPRAPKKATGKPKPATPYLANAPQKTTVEGRPNNPMLPDKLDMKDWDVDPMKVMNQLIDRELKADEYSGMVS